VQEACSTISFNTTVSSKFRGSMTSNESPSPKGAHFWTHGCSILDSYTILDHQEIFDDCPIRNLFLSCPGPKIYLFGRQGAGYVRTPSLLYLSRYFFFYPLILQFALLIAFKLRSTLQTRREPKRWHGVTSLTKSKRACPLGENGLRHYFCPRFEPGPIITNQ
jgi:hypothetical protein